MRRITVIFVVDGFTEVKNYVDFENFKCFRKISSLLSVRMEQLDS